MSEEKVFEVIQNNINYYRTVANEISQLCINKEFREAKIKLRELLERLKNEIDENKIIKEELLNLEKYNSSEKLLASYISAVEGSYANRQGITKHSMIGRNAYNIESEFSFVESELNTYLENRA